MLVFPGEPDVVVGRSGAEALVRRLLGALGMGALTARRVGSARGNGTGVGVVKGVARSIG